MTDLHRTTGSDRNTAGLRAASLERFRESFGGMLEEEGVDVLRIDLPGDRIRVVYATASDAGEVAVGDEVVSIANWYIHVVDESAGRIRLGLRGIAVDGARERALVWDLEPQWIRAFLSHRWDSDRLKEAIFDATEAKPLGELDVPTDGSGEVLPPD